ncbi:hypothetical protein IGI04_037254 [Brassica rapa subsp. trilocularis]|uniref:CCT domain-containing protein n=1 Tax=Brassica rapa subsp. trilocularis TaxID=1813537 RepID=A0ABQ7LJU2_BRACM|nr:hypothetical protein IGI04_037254 [Brassica rapa subsp. trilocularis]
MTSHQYQLNQIDHFFIFSKMPRNKKCYLLIPKRQELLLERFASFGSIPSTYIEGSGDWHRVRKRRLQMRFKIFATQKLIKGKRPLNKKKNKYALRGLRSLAVARRTVPEDKKKSSDGPWELVGGSPLFDPP